MSWRLPYEKQITSQHGEDGIIEQMVDAIINPDKTFLEIGWGDGGSNMTWHLMMDKGWGGIGVDAKEPGKGRDRFPPQFRHMQEFVYPDTCTKYLDLVPLNCDFFSLDIDSFDYEIAKTLFAAGFRPKTVCVEINQRFGANDYGSFPFETPRKRLYDKVYKHGVSLQKYIAFFNHYGYEYFGYDSSCVNAFFYKKDECNYIDLPILKLEDFSYQTNQIKENLKDTFWEDKADLIFQDKFVL
jgi:hypothetical protein